MALVAMDCKIIFHVSHFVEALLSLRNPKRAMVSLVLPVISNIVFS